jgi:hypothetical protein
MSLSLMGVVPVSGITLGMVAALPTLQAEITQLGLDIADLGLTTAKLAANALTPPDPTGFMAALSALPLMVQGITDPTKVVTAGAEANVELVAKLGVVSLALAAGDPIGARLTAGMGGSGFGVWCYSGTCAGLVSLSPGAFGQGWQRGLLIATESLASWGTFGQSVNTGPSGSAPSGGPPSLTHLGSWSAGKLCPGFLEVSGQIGKFLLRLRGMKASLEGDIAFTLGLNLPNPLEVLDEINNLIAEAEQLLESMLQAPIDLTVDIGTIQARVDVVLEMTGKITAQLSAGGMAVWGYSEGSDLGNDIASTLASGIPGGSGVGAEIRAMVIAHASQPIWSPFGLIFGGFV